MKRNLEDHSIEEGYIRAKHNKCIKEIKSSRRAKEHQGRIVYTSS